MKMDKSESILLFVSIVGMITLVVGFPFAIIWSLNHLFEFGFAYSFWNWLAVFVLNLAIKGPTKILNNSS